MLTIADDDALLTYAKAIVAELRGHGVRAEGDDENDPIKAKIAHAEQAKVHTMFVLGADSRISGSDFALV